MRLYGLQKQRRRLIEEQTQTEAPSATRDNTCQESQATCQILDVPVPPVMEVSKMVSPHRIQPWTAERIVDVPVPMVSEEHVDITKVSSQNRVQKRFKEQGVDGERIRSVELKRLSMCQPGQWRRCPSILETQVSP